VRFANEVAGVDDLGTTGRGNDMQIGTYIEKMINSEMSGNVIDLCPVGALTSKPYEFTARPWELKKTESIDVMDAVGSAIRVDSRGLEVMRVLPRLHEEVNEEWISDKTRFAYDGLKRQRLATPFIRKNGRLEAVTWPEALHTVSNALHAALKDSKAPKGSGVRAIAGDLADAESLVALKDLLNRMGSEEVYVDAPHTPAHGVDLRASYTMNSTLEGVEEADALLLIGTNPKHEAAVFNGRIRKAYLRGLDIGWVGEKPADAIYAFDHLGDGVDGIAQLMQGNHAFSAKLKQAKKPMIIVGSGVVEHQEGQSVLAQVAALVNQHKEQFYQEGWNGVNVLQREAGRTAALDIGYGALPSNASKPFGHAKFLYLLNADNIDAAQLPADTFVVYQGHHGDVGAHHADVILPGLAYTEKASTYVSTEGRAQATRAAVTPPGAAREDWTIVRALSEVAGFKLPYDDVHGLHARMEAVSPTLVPNERVESSAFGPLATTVWSTYAQSKTAGALSLPIKDFYQTNVVSRSSKVMAQCSSAFQQAEPDLEHNSAY
jgi:NADH dehydrogenase (ubiquinone) Fe-S protein 1